MKAIGIVRPIDELGRIVIPKETRDLLNIQKKDPIEIFMSGDTVVLRKYEPACIFCDNTDDTIRYNGRLVCRNCFEKMQEMFGAADD